MKKTLTIISSSILLSLSSMLNASLPFDVDIDVDFSYNKMADLSELSMYSQFGYESEYVFRGQQLADHSFQGFVEASLGGLYTGVWTNLPFTNDNNQFADEFDFYIGCLIPVNEYIQGDVGFKYYFYPQDDNVEINRTREFHVGFSLMEAVFTPSAYLYYDTDLQQTVFEFSGSKVFDISQIAANTNLSFKSHLGVVNTRNFDAGQAGPRPNGHGEENAYVYWGFNADVIYNFTDTVNTSVGIRYTGNNDGDSMLDTQTGEREDNLWWGLAFNAGF